MAHTPHRNEENDWNSLLTSDTYQTDETQSSATTVWGPGTLSGKAIKSLGEASLRGLDHLIIRWKLARINSGLSKSNAASSGTSPSSLLSVEKLEKICDDLLELSRLDFYDAKVRQKALRLIMIQIGSRETSQLISCIMKWPQQEIRIFLSEMMDFMPILWSNDVRSTLHSADNAQTLFYPDLISVYRSSQSPAELHEVIPFLSFTTSLARKGPAVGRAVIEAGFLSFLTKLHQNYDVRDSIEPVVAARDALEVLMEDHDALLEQYRMDLIWPRGTSTIPLTRRSLELANLTPDKRTVSWRNAESSWIRERLCEIQVILEMPTYHDAKCKTDLFDVCLDLVTFHDFHDRVLAQQSFTLLLQCIAIGGELRDALKAVLIHTSYEQVLGVFYRMTYPTLQIKFEEHPIFLHLSQQITTYHPEIDPVDYIVEFAVEVAGASHHCARAIVDADIISLLSSTTEQVSKGEVLRCLQTAARSEHEQDPSKYPHLQTNSRLTGNRPRSVTV
ncbi:hypothetical protein E1B28_007586 [Marasmius oreades]|uniref:Uncharacterized protein n=1 Tax=Marasmius oreades TaxID=181124 RepID=A0A9P7S2H0_9AGAR|nr:uncharacterized protein E1B28_007586 [Marasmius oreades]KAG7093953.1 hypothetical protein E1B28_007586 [Marasmius oreades]